MNFRIVSIIFSVTFLMLNKVSAYVLSYPTTAITYPSTFIEKLPHDRLKTASSMGFIDDYLYMEYLMDQYTPEEFCEQFGGVYDKENGDCIDPKRVVYTDYIPTTKTIPVEYRESHWYKKYPKGLPTTTKVITKTTQAVQTPPPVATTTIMDVDEFLRSITDFEEFCIKGGGTYNKEKGHCYDPNIPTEAYTPTSKTIPVEYRDAHWKYNQYPKTLTNFEVICSELGGAYNSYLGNCVAPEPTPTDSMSTSTVEAIQMTEPPSPVTTECALPWGQCGGTNYSGPSCCPDGFVCKKYTEWFSQCAKVF